MDSYTVKQKILRKRELKPNIAFISQYSMNVLVISFCQKHIQRNVPQNITNIFFSNVFPKHS